MTAKEHFEKGMQKRDDSDYEGAIEEFSKAVEKDSDFSEAYYERGKIRQILSVVRPYPEFVELLEKAIDDFTEVVRLNPNHAEAYFVRGMARIQLRKQESGCADFKKAKELGFELAEEIIKEYC